MTVINLDRPEYIFIQTYGGKAFDIFDPTPEMVTIENIAHALSLLCRFGGHCSEFYSVGDHSLRCAAAADPEFKLEALLHDGAEAYLVDMPRPIKNILKDYKTLELKIEKVIAEKFGLPFPMSSHVKNIDSKMLITEKRDLMGPSEREWEGEWPDPYPDVIVPRKDPKKVEELFLDEFYKLTW